jgi:O-antigen/teichoic acid export membrane protein
LNIKLLKNIFLYGIGDFIVTGVSAFLFIPLYLKFLSTEEYGILNILNNNTTLFTYVFQLGIISAFSRVYFLKKEKDIEREYIRDIIYMHFVYSIFLFLMYISFNSVIINNLSPSISGSKLVYYSIFVAFFSFVPSLYYVYLRLVEKANKFVQFQVLTVALITIFILLNYLLYEINLYSILGSIFLANFIIWILVLSRIDFSVTLKINIDDILKTLRFAFPFFISYVAFFFISKYSVIILQNYVSLKEIGQFSLAQQIAIIPSLVSIGITKAIQPMLFSSKSDGELRAKAQNFDKNYKLLMIWMVGLLIFLLDFIFRYLLPPIYFEIINVTKYLVLINLVYNFAVVENAILLYKMKSNIILLITISGSVLNVFLCNILIQNNSTMGVVIAMASAYCLNLSLELYFSRKFIKLVYNFKAIILSLLIIFVDLIISSSYVLNISDFFKAKYSILSFIILSIFIGLQLKKINPSEVV